MDSSEGKIFVSMDKNRIGFCFVDLCRDWNGHFFQDFFSSCSVLILITFSFFFVLNINRSYYFMQCLCVWNWSEQMLLCCCCCCFRNFDTSRWWSSNHLVFFRRRSNAFASERTRKKAEKIDSSFTWFFFQFFFTKKKCKYENCWYVLILNTKSNKQMCVVVVFLYYILILIKSYIIWISFLFCFIEFGFSNKNSVPTVTLGLSFYRHPFVLWFFFKFKFVNYFVSSDFDKLKKKSTILFCISFSFFFTLWNFSFEEWFGAGIYELFFVFWLEKTMPLHSSERTKKYSSDKFLRTKIDLLVFEFPFWTNILRVKDKWQLIANQNNKIERISLKGALRFVTFIIQL